MFREEDILTQNKLLQIVHHEYAGLAEIETNLEDNSRYFLTRQLSFFHTSKQQRYLGIQKKHPKGFAPGFIDDNIIISKHNLSGAFKCDVKIGENIGISRETNYHKIRIFCTTYENQFNLLSNTLIFPKDYQAENVQLTLLNVMSGYGFSLHHQWGDRFFFVRKGNSSWNSPAPKVTFWQWVVHLSKGMYR